MISPFADEIAVARAAQASWSQLEIRDRLQRVHALRSLIVDNTDAMIEAAGLDIGRSAVEVLATELLPAAASLQFLEKQARSVLAPRRISSRSRPLWLMGCRDEIHRRPWGVVGIIGTWNYPIFLNVGPIAQTLVAGNAVLWKPSENAPRTAVLLHELFRNAGFPAGLLRLLPATREAGPQLARAAIDYLVFTGSDAVGRKLAATLGERLVPSTLELSGCDAMLVLEDADIELASRAAWFAVTLNRGQTCIAARRIFVHRSRHTQFEEAIRKLAASAQAVKLVTPGQAEQARRLIEDACHRGARTTGAKVVTEIAPTFLFDASADAAICHEACFAPLAAVIPFDSLDNCTTLIQKCSFGLGASIFTANLSLAHTLAARIPAGSVCINDVLAPTAHPATSFGGRGSSGWGVTQGREGLLAMTVPQVVTSRRNRFRPHFDEAIAPDPATGDILRGLLRWTHGRGVREKLRGLGEMWKGVRRKR